MPATVDHRNVRVRLDAVSYTMVWFRPAAPSLEQPAAWVVRVGGPDLELECDTEAEARALADRLLPRGDRPG